MSRLPIPSPMRCILAVAALTPALAAAQEPDPQLLEPVEVTITREAARAVLDLPFAISVVRPDSARPGQRRLALDETLLAIPGVTVANRHNPTQDPRISIRGFGSRSAFGVRGIRVLRDGIPLTLPDGQTPVDYLDLESVGTVEVIRGSAAALYGNAAGGVIDIRTARAPTEALAGRGRLMTGSFGMARGHAMTGGSTSMGTLGWQAHLTHTRSDGFRHYSAQRATTAHLHTRAAIAGDHELAVHLMLFDMPVAENPGALTLAELRADPTTAEPLAVQRRARKEVRQGQVGISLARPLGAGEVIAAVYGGKRSLDNPLPFAIVDIGRATYGTSVRTAAPMRLFGVRQRLTAGIDAQWQDDDRTNFENCNRDPATIPPGLCPDPGAERGRLRLDQRERVMSVGPFVRTEIELTPRILASIGARADRVRFDVRDRLVTETDPDDSGTRTLSAVSPVFGLVARIGERSALYTTVSSSFETPTATELANQPDGSAGLNRELDPQRATTWEVGVKGELLGWLRYDAAAYTTEVRDELIPFEVPGGAGRRFFRNAGKTLRRGVEGGLGVSAGTISAQLSYALAHFRFVDFTLDGESFGGSRIPGIPRQQLQGSVTWNVGRVFLTAEGVAASSAFVNDANTARAAGYEVLNLRAGAQALFGRPWLSPTVGLENVFDRTFVPSVNVNAAGGRFYEPAAGRAVYLALTAQLGQ